MKGYRGIFPPALVLLLIMSIYMAAKNNRQTDHLYHDYLAKARECVELGIIVDAEVYYEEALDIKPSLNVYLEYLFMYIEIEQYEEAQDLGEDIVDKYNKNAAAYAGLGKAYYLDEDYDDFYELYDKYKKKNLSSPEMEEMYAEIEYLYTYSNQYEDVGSFSNGRCAVKMETGWGFVSESGKKKIPYVYKYAGTFGNEIAPVETEDGEWYFIDVDGNKKKVLNKIDSVEKIGTVASNIIPVYNGEQWAFYDMEQNLICGGYDSVSSMGNGYAAVKQGEKWYLIDSSGGKITEQSYGDIIQDEKNIAFRGCYFAKMDGLYYMFNENGEKITEQGFEDARLFNETDSLAAVEIYGKWGFVNLNGEIIIEPQFADAGSFSNGLAAVKLDDLWGYIDLTGNLVIDNIFTDAREFNDSGNAMVRVGDTWQMIKLLKYQ